MRVCNPSLRATCFCLQALLFLALPTWADGITNSAAMPELTEGTRFPAGPPGGPGSPWSAGVFALARTDRYKGVDERLLALPMIAYRGEKLVLLGPAARFRVFQGHKTALWGVGAWRFEGYSSGDSPVLRGLPDRHGTLEVGLLATRALNDNWSLSAQFNQDVLDRHGGQQLQTSIDRKYRLGRGRLATFQLGLNWMSPAMADYYFGVSSRYATPDRPAYDCGWSAFTGKAGVTLVLPFGARWNVMLALGMAMDAPAIRDSPIVSKDLQRSAVLSLARGLF